VASPLTIRFLENAYYDIEQDLDVVRLMAVTGTGTWSMVVPAKGRRTKKAEFKEYVMERLYKGEIPCELEELQDG
jgi:hypothetical protein